MAEEEKSINVTVSEENTTKAPGDAFENYELKFPCEFPLSVMGINEAGYPDMVYEIIRKHVPQVRREDLSLSYSSNEKYCSVKTRFTADSREQMDKLYKELTANEKIKWVL